jgi:hypothetical protein
MSVDARDCEGPGCFDPLLSESGYEIHPEDVDTTSNAAIEAQSASASTYSTGVQYTTYALP